MDEIQILRSWYLPSNLSKAASHLYLFKWWLGLHQTYHYFFHDQYANVAKHWLIYEEDDSYPMASEWELNLFNLINEHLFPMPEGVLEGEEIPSGIPVVSPYMLNWWDLDYEDLSISFQLVIRLWNPDIFNHFKIPDFFTRKLLKKIKALDGLDGKDLDIKLLESKCAEHPYLSILPLLISFLDKDTGNPWIDYNDELHIEYEWNIKNLELLTEQWHECEDTFSKISSLDEWLESSHKNIHKLVDLWQECQQIQPPQSPKPLINVMNGLIDNEFE